MINPVDEGLLAIFVLMICYGIIGGDVFHREIGYKDITYIDVTLYVSFFLMLFFLIDILLNLIKKTNFI